MRCRNGFSVVATESRWAAPTSETPLSVSPFSNNFGECSPVRVAIFVPRSGICQSATLIGIDGS